MSSGSTGVQFEVYLPSKPDLHHMYDSPRHTTIGGVDFYVDSTIMFVELGRSESVVSLLCLRIFKKGRKRKRPAWVRAADDKTTPGSDLEHIQVLVRAKGYKLPAGMMSVRLVHLLDEARRKELMIIYSEDLAATGFTAAICTRAARLTTAGLATAGLFGEPELLVAYRDSLARQKALLSGNVVGEHRHGQVRSPIGSYRCGGR